MEKVIKKFSTIIKNLNINNKDLLNSYNKNFRHNVKGIKLNNKNIIKNKIAVKDVYQEYKNLENMKILLPSILIKIL